MTLAKTRSRRAVPVSDDDYARLSAIVRLQGVDIIRRRVALLSLIMSVPPLFATQSGTFHYGKVKFEPIDSFAYQAETQQSGKPLTIVVLTDFKIDRPAVLAAINTPGAFVLQSGEKGSFAMLRLVAPEKCGVAGFLASTQQQFDLGDSLTAKMTVSTPSRVA